MRKIFFDILMSCFIISFLAGCSSSNSNIDKRIVMQINKYKMRVEDLKYELKNIPYDIAYLLETEEGRKEYINRLLEKEILLQEAQKEGIDREKDFMKSIENYWKQALLKSLLQRKSREISGLVHVYDNEIEEYYKNSGEDLPFSNVKEDITRTLRQKKETEAMNVWMEELKEKSRIKTDEEVIKEFFK